MRRLSVCLIALASSLAAARAEPDLCRAAADGVEASLRAFRPGARAKELFRGISIRNAVARKPAAGLDYGAALDDATLKKFPLTSNDRAFFKESARRIFRSGGASGLVLLDAEAGTAHCHTSFLFSLAAGEPKALPNPDAADPFDVCGHGNVALGAVAGTPFYAQTYDDFIETDWMKIFTPAGESLTMACTLDAKYAVLYEMTERHCAQPELCAAFSERVAQWARNWIASKGQSVDPALSPAEAGATPEDDPAALPTFGAAPSRLAPAPFRFDGGENWFALKGDDRPDALRIGAAAQGPANMAQWESFTLAALYKSGRPVASFVVQRRRGAFQSLAVLLKD